MESNLELKTAHHHVYARLRELIVDGAIEPGDRLDERALSQALGVSRTPVREAVTRLLSDGLVEHRPYRGNFVRRLDARQVAGLYDARCALEALAVEQATPALTDDALMRIKAALDSAGAALDAGDMAAFATADRRFHQIVAECSGNEAVIGLLENLDAQIRLVRGLANRDADFVARTTNERAQILDALASRDAQRAAKLMREHIEDVKRTVVAQLVEGTRRAGEGVEQ